MKHDKEYTAASCVLFLSKGIQQENTTIQKGSISA